MDEVVPLTIPFTITPNQRDMTDLVLRFDDKNLLVDPTLYDKFIKLRGEHKCRSRQLLQMRHTE